LKSQQQKREVGLRRLRQPAQAGFAYLLVQFQLPYPPCRGSAMRAPYTQLYLHCVWATWDRLPLITPAIEARLYPAIVAKSHKLKCETIAIGGIEDHVHLLVRFPTTLTVATLLKEVKGASSHLVTHEITPDEFFKWQGAYGAFTVGKEGVDAATAYILNQKTHHAEEDLTIEWEQCELVDEGGNPC
jgi:REP element-mobilizing transposase RayT